MGVVVYNILGYICYVVFFLFFYIKKIDDYILLFIEKFVVVKEIFLVIKLIVIDEILMVGVDILLIIYR